MTTRIAIDPSRHPAEPPKDCCGDPLAPGDDCILLCGEPVASALGITVTVAAWTDDGLVILDDPYPDPDKLWAVEPQHLMRKPALQERRIE